MSKLICINNTEILKIVILVPYDNRLDIYNSVVTHLLH